MCITVIYLIIINNNKNDISNHKHKIRRERKIKCKWIISSEGTDPF